MIQPIALGGRAATGKHPEVDDVLDVVDVVVLDRGVEENVGAFQCDVARGPESSMGNLGTVGKMPRSL